MYLKENKAIHSKWVFQVKLLSDDTLDKCKIRIVSKGFLQVIGVDYFDTFSPMVKSITVRVMLIIVLYRGWSIRQLDVNNIFLNGNLTKSVYMSSSFCVERPSGLICKLKKAINGLKHAPRAWYHELSSSIPWVSNAKSKSSLFIKSIALDLVFILAYMDGILITGNDPHALSQLVMQLHKHFTLKWLGPLGYFYV